ncbi:MAG: acyl-CoA synthetase FdrA [Geminicoccaceae bacterium]|nr:acyl-CoA synthetase FdrA [Geminicoccaceae bacterium]
MSAVVNLVRKGFYLDSVGLMRMSREIAALDGVEDAALMMGTPANREIMANAGVLAAEGAAASSGDLVLAVRAEDEATARLVLTKAQALLDQPRRGGTTSAAWRPKTVRAAQRAVPSLDLALISVPGEYAASEARKALMRGLDVMIFSDNVPIEQEVELKLLARELGRLVMGPDCGTAIIGGVPLAFANRVPRGSIGIVGASGTGTQEVSCIIAREGGGISHAIGTGGRDLKESVGGITTLRAIDLLDEDPATETVVLVSKPPAAGVVRIIRERIARSGKRFVVCFLGLGEIDLPANAQAAPTLRDAAFLALGKPVAGKGPDDRCRPAGTGRRVEGLFAGGTLCAEAQTIFLRAGLEVSSNVPVPGASAMPAAGHRLVDLGDDEYTRGKPHPMIDPGVRDQPFEAALRNPANAVVLLDVVLGHGGHADPAGAIVAVLERHAGARPAVIASVTGTRDDPQDLRGQVAKLEAAGVDVRPSNADAAETALGRLDHG